LYNEEFYKNVSKQRNEEMTNGLLERLLLAVQNLRMEPIKEGAEEQRLYIMTAVLAVPYRGRNIEVSF
jgi:hypothetical protein